MIFINKNSNNKIKTKNQPERPHTRKIVGFALMIFNLFIN